MDAPGHTQRVLHRGQRFAAARCGAGPRYPDGDTARRGHLPVSSSAPASARAQSGEPASGAGHFAPLSRRAGAPRKRGAHPSDHQRGQGLRDLHARQGRPSGELESGCTGALRIRCKGDHRPSFRDLLSARPQAAAGKRTRRRRPQGLVRGRVLALAQGRNAVLRR